MKGLIEGLTVHYVLTQSDAEEISRRRSNIPYGSDDWPVGAQAHVGNPVSEGEHCAMIVAKVWDHAEDGPGTCNGQVILDGNDSLWVTSRYYDESGAPGTWHWIEPA